MKVCKQGLKKEIDFVALPHDGKMNSKEIRKQRGSYCESNRNLLVCVCVCVKGVGSFPSKYSTNFPCSSKQPPTHALTENHNQTKWIRSKQIKAKIPSNQKETDWKRGFW